LDYPYIFFDRYVYQSAGALCMLGGDLHCDERQVDMVGYHVDSSQASHFKVGD